MPNYKNVYSAAVVDWKISPLKPSTLHLWKLGKIRKKTWGGYGGSVLGWENCGEVDQKNIEQI